MDAIKWITENWDKVLAAIGAFYTFASVIAAITPSNKDNTILEKIGAWADRIGLNIKGK